MTRKVRTFSYLAILVFATALASIAQTLHTPDVIYVPTPQAVVEEMLRMANVSSSSLVYDLGCGDGRTVITAAKQYGAHGVGIDIDPQRIEESRRNANQAGVNGRVKFILGDLFESDFHNATAVTLYLLSTLNVRLRPILFRQLKPGTPVVSHDFDMGEWQPDEMKIVSAEDREHRVYKWIIPAEVAGTWHFTAAGNQGPSYDIVMQQSFQKITGTVRRNGQEIAIPELHLSGTQLSFLLPAGEEFNGSVDSRTVSGTISSPDGATKTQMTGRLVNAAASAQIQ